MVYRRLMVCCLSSIGLSVAVAMVSAAEPPRSSADKSAVVSAVPEQKTESDSRALSAARASGREIFLREWIPNDPRSHGGDGLGPVFNETSCVSCHNQGGVGGGGSEAKNVTVISAIRTNNPDQPRTRVMPQAPVSSRTAVLQPATPPGLVPPPAAISNGAVPQTPGRVAQGAPAAQAPEESAESQERKRLLEDLRKLHPGLVTARSVILHNSGTDPKYAAWRDRVLGFDVATMAPQFNRGLGQQVIPKPAESSGFFANLIAESQRQELLEKLPPLELQGEKIRGLFFHQSLVAVRVQQQLHRPGVGNLSVAASSTQRNSTALFGTGLIDSIPDAVLEAAAARKIEEFPEISGRVARLKDGRIGRFGWKAQKANLYDFTMTACAVELGLHVPDHPQAGVPLKPDYEPAGFDLNREECLDLVQFLRDLPAPARRVEESPAIASELKKGEQVFTKIGCAACHTEELGAVAGIFSDLLLHDLGAELGDSGSYGAFQPQSSGNDAEDPLAGLLNDSTPNTILASQDPFDNQTDSAVRIAALKTEERLPEKMVGAGRQEWRTAPLWGVRDSAPYMHDGRAGTIEQAIAFHGGEAQLSANRFFRLKPDERTSLLAFMRSLVAPETLASAGK